jgi:hypothetical protein
VSPASFLPASSVLGVAVSGRAPLCGTAPPRLPSTAAGMLIDIETMPGSACVYAARAEWPPARRSAGFAAVLVGVAPVLRLRARHPPDVSLQCGLAAIVLFQCGPAVIVLLQRGLAVIVLFNAARR